MKINKYSLYLAGALTLGACQSVEQLSIDHMIPAEISFPTTLKRVAVVNNMPAVPPGDTILIEKEVESKEDGTLQQTAYYTGDAALTAEALAAALAEENYFDEVVICDSALRANDTIPQETVLSAEEVKRLTDDLDVDFLISVERAQIKATTKISFVPDFGGYYYGATDVKVFPSFKIYLPGRTTPMATVNSTDSIFWDNTGSTERDLRARLVDKDELVKAASEFAGTTPVKHILPHWKTVTRYLFSGGSVNMRDAAVYVREKNWEQAIVLWKQEYASRKGKSQMRAAYNIALGYEMQDSIQAAVEWAEKAQKLAYEVDKVGEAQKEGNKVKNMPNYLATTVYLTELQERQAGITRLDAQMGRFDGDF